MTQSLNSTFTVFLLLATITHLFPRLLLQVCVVLLWASWPLALHTLVRVHGTCQIISIIEKVDQLAPSFTFPVSPKWEEWVMLELIVPLTTDLPPPPPHSNLLRSLLPLSLAIRPSHWSLCYHSHNHYSSSSTHHSLWDSSKTSFSSVCAKILTHLGSTHTLCTPTIMSLCMPFLYLGSTWIHWTHTCKSLTKKKKRK